MATTCATASTHCVPRGIATCSAAWLSRHGAQHQRYLGGFPIAAALAERGHRRHGRVVDSALILGPLIHEFGWKPTTTPCWRRATAAGHLLECGAQSTGDLHRLARCARLGPCRLSDRRMPCDGTIVMTKPDGSGGLCSVGTVAEQLLYEVSDPQAYIVPDVVVDFSSVTLEQIGPDRVLVRNVKGYAPTATIRSA